MSHGSHHAPVDVFRKVVIVSVLFAALLGMYQFGVSHGGSVDTVLLAVGFVILASYTIGELAEVVKLPHITGYLLAGLVLGGSAAHTLAEWELVRPWLFPPFDHGLLDSGVLEKLGPMDTLALALICLTAGGELKLEDLRSGFGRIIAILGAQTVTIMLGVTGFFWLISGPVAALTFEPIASLDTAAVLGLGAVLASVSLATAPAATIAIINSTGAKGPMTGNVLPVVVLKDVVVVLCFSAAVAVATSLLPDAGGGGGLGSTLAIIAVSMVFGAIVVGGAIHLYLRYIGAEVLLFIIGMVYAAAEGATWLTHQIDPAGHAELALVFIAAGFAASNFSSKGDALIHQVERLSLPVYVVFFTMAGAKLHLEDLLSSGVFALGLVTVRILMLVVGVRLGAVVSFADGMTQRYGWMGFVSQAGLALTLAGTVQLTFEGPVGDGLFSLILAGVALNEIVGPVLLQVGLQLAGETAAQRDQDASEEAPEEVSVQTVSRTQAEEVSWGTPLPNGNAKLDQLSVHFEADLKRLVRDLQLGALEEQRVSATAHVQALRMDFLRFHRRIHSRSGDPDLGGVLRKELAALASRWRDQLLKRAALVHRNGWSPASLERQLFELVRDWQDVAVPHAPSAWTFKTGDSAWMRIARSALRVRSRLFGRQRHVPVHELGRYHVHGVLTGRLEALAASVINHELELVQRTSTLFENIEAAVAVAGDHADPVLAVKHLRQALEEDFTLAAEDAGWVQDETVRRATTIFSTALQHFREDLLHIDTPDLPRRQRRFASVFDVRTEGLQAITGGLERAEDLVASRYGALALALEVVSLQANVEEAVQLQASMVGRQIRGKGLTQLSRCATAVRQLRVTAEALLTEEDPQTDLPGIELAKHLREAVEPAERVVVEAIEAGKALRDWLASEDSDEALLDSILQSASALTETYEVPSGAAQLGEWKLPSGLATIEVPFRELAVTFIEAHVTRELIEVTRTLATQIDTQVHALQDLQRILNFNADLAIGELEVHRGPIPGETRALVQEMVLDSWARGSLRLSEVMDHASGLPAQAADEVTVTVQGQLERFRTLVFEGRIAELRSASREGTLFIAAGGWRTQLWQGTEQLQSGLAATLGDDRLTAIRDKLGFVKKTEMPSPDVFAPPLPLQRLPTVYRRLFSDQALEAGDLITGRDSELDLGTSTLRGTVGTFRSVALIGEDGIGKRALANALLRSHGRVVRFTPTEATDVHTVDTLFDENEGGAVLLDGLDHLFTLAPQGFAPLERLIDRMVADAGNTVFVGLFERPVWEFANRATDLRAVFAAQIPMRHLSPTEIESALLARHNMSGYALTFEAGTDLAWHVADLLARDEDPQRRRQKTWFRTLHEASDGRMQDALRLWMASIVDVDESTGSLRIGSVQRPPLARLRRLPESVLLTLRQVVSQGSTTAAEHARQFRTSEAEARAHLASLGHAGLLQAEGNGWRVASHLVGPVVDVLTARGWLC